MSTLGSFRLHYRLYTGIGIALLIIVLALTRTIPADAKVAIFDSLFAERQVEVKNDAVTNSIQNLHTHTWSTFSGELPEVATVNDISLILVWSKTQDENVVDAEVILPVSSEQIFDNDESSSGSGAYDAASSSDSEILNDDNEDDSSTSTEDVEEVIIDTAEEEVVVEQVSEEILNESNEAEEAEVFEVESTEPVVEESPTAFLQKNLDRFLALARIIPVAEAFIEGDAEISSTSEEPVSEVSETIVETSNTPVLPDDGIDEVSSSTNEEVPTEIEATSTPLYPTLESASVQYSFDGDMWTNLGTINLVESNQALLSLGIDQFASIESLQVKVVYLAPQDATLIVFGNAQLQLDYTPVLVEEIIPPPSDNEPNFLVSSVKLDIEKEGVRAVLLERGGVLELWAVILYVNEDDMVWRRLASGNTLSEVMSIDIYNGTVFWFEKSSYTLLAYDLENESLTGTNQADLSSDTYILDFSEGRKMFRATFNSDSSTFQFNQVYP